jgi:hypothetical protein
MSTGIEFLKVCHNLHASSRSLPNFLQHQRKYTIEALAKEMRQEFAAVRTDINTMSTKMDTISTVLGETFEAVVRVER